MSEVHDSIREMFHEDSIDGTAARPCPLAFVKRAMFQNVGDQVPVPDDTQKEIKIGFEDVDNANLVNPGVTEEFLKHANNCRKPTIIDHSMKGGGI